MRAASGYYFLGIVAMEDMLEGNMMPSYIVCQSKRKSESRSGLRVVKANSTMVGMDKLLVANIHAHPELIDFMSNYRTRDHMHTKNLRQRARTRKYTPEGGLFWFPCTASGLMCRYNYKPIFIKLVPDNEGRATDDGFTRLKAAREHIPSWKEVLLREPYGKFIETEGWRNEWQLKRQSRIGSQS